MKTKVSSEHLKRIAASLGAMGDTGPRNLAKYLRAPTPDFDPISDAQTCAMIAHLLNVENDSPEARRLDDLLRSWDNAKDAEWTKNTPRNSKSRRALIYELLGLAPGLRAAVDKRAPFFLLEEPMIIAQEHRDWYEPEKPPFGYYWETYKKYLRGERKWGAASILELDNATRSIVECLACPFAREAYASRGLVVGYVQSGKTANFTGVVARAADAGYRLIIILAGTWNILRNQTQRRLDKELLGKELLRNDESYTVTPPADWDEFLEHGSDPAERGIFGWQRITRPDYDFRLLKGAIEALEFGRFDQGKPLYDPANLARVPVKLLVVKKTPAILNKLIHDFKLLETRLADLPALIIDDESDQAGLNTLAPAQREADKTRTATNAAIVKLLGLLPRGQYAGYTATPYANALIDPDDQEDLFPKDFIVSLERPAGYMGISDFFDPFVEYEDIKPAGDFSFKEIAFIRRVSSPQGSDDVDLQAAIRAFVLSGAIRLFREKHGGSRCRNHTMLVHTSSKVAEHARVADGVEELWNRCAFSSTHGVAKLRNLFESEFKPVSRIHGEDQPFPRSFDVLKPFISEVIRRVTRGQRLTLVLNNDSPDTPDFSGDGVWKIIVGGNKLSRGYTIEGLTISYYRRMTKTADTLMQMGRWFGFRPGYRDLVRVYLGVNEGRGGADLVSLFKTVCRMEESFRDEIKRYIRRTGVPRITPRDIPPLIEVTGQLLPTARNKMFNAVITSRNYDGRWCQPTLVATKPAGARANRDAVASLMRGSRLKGANLLLEAVLAPGSQDRMVAHVFESTTQEIIKFLGSFHWLETEFTFPRRPSDIGLQIEFLDKQKHGIRSWLVLFPQRKDSVGSPFIPGDHLPLCNVKERHRVDGRGFQQFGEPVHRRFAHDFTGVPPNSGAAKHVSLSGVAKTLAKVTGRRGVLLVYAVREAVSAPHPDMGFEVLYPPNDLDFDMTFSVRTGKSPAAITVPASGR